MKKQLCRDKKKGRMRKNINKLVAKAKKNQKVADKQAPMGVGSVAAGPVSEIEKPTLPPIHGSSDEITVDMKLKPYG